MIALRSLLFAVAFAAFAGQVPDRAPDAEELSLQAFMQAVETAISTMDRNRWIDLLSPTADRDQSLEFFDAMVPQGITRVVVKERDRSALQGALPGEGYPARSSRCSSRPGTAAALRRGGSTSVARAAKIVGRQPWRILAEERLASIEGLHRLSLQREKQYAARNLVICGHRLRRCACRPAMCSSPKPPRASPRSC